MGKIRIPYSYTLDNGNIIVDEWTGNIVREVFEKFCDGVYVAKLKEHVQGLDRNRHKINSILSDRRYLGTDFFPEIISSEMFEKAQKIKANRLKSVGKEKKYDADKESCIFSSKIICGECGNEFHRYKHGDTIQWECSNQKANGRIHCQNMCVLDEQLIQSFMRVERKLIKHPDLLDNKNSGSRKTVISGRYKAVDREIKKAEASQKLYEADEMIHMIYRRAALLYEVSEADDYQYYTKK